MSSPTSAAGSRAALYAASFWGIWLRDSHVLRASARTFITRVLMQPLFLVFVFAYVFPKIGQEVRATDDVTFATILAPGLVAFAVVFQGINLVAFPLVNEISASREIEDRVMAPLPTTALALEKLLFGAFQGLIAALIVWPLLYFVPVAEVEVRIESWPLLTAVLLLSTTTAGAAGLAIGTAMKPNQIPLVVSLITSPVIFLGCVFYPWQELVAIPWLQVVVLVNPLVYVSEGLRATLTPQLPHLLPWVSISALAVATTVLGAIGVRGFHKRVLD
ncbi:MAG: ABC transporter permease [Actinobacteria bacterium]|nr:ABC transporter permease [Actinomycetota bacterium]